MLLTPSSELFHHLTWSRYIEAAFPAVVAHSEADKGLLWHVARWLGVRVAFVLYHLGFSADVVSILAWFLSICALASLVWMPDSPRWGSVAVFLCCYSSVFLDFCDGPLARIRGTTGLLGKTLDGIATDFLRGGLLVALGVTAASTPFLIMGVVAAYTIVFIRNQFIWNGLSREIEIPDGPLTSLLNEAFSVKIMLVAFPVLIAAAGFCRILPIISRCIVTLYALLGAMWFLLAYVRASQESRKRLAKSAMNGEPKQTPVAGC
jgi:phosphatidylglycerophosphate synthase